MKLNSFFKKLIPLPLSFLYILLLSILVSFSLYQIFNPPSYDAIQYRLEAQSYVSANDLLAGANAQMRLYGYPLFLAIFYKLFNPSLVGIMLFLTQTLLYIIAVLLVSSSVGKVFPKAKVFVHFALLSNIFLYPYLAISLSDSLSVILWILIAFIIIEIFISESLPAARLFFFLGLTIGFSIMVRPSNIQLLALIPIILMLWLYYKKELNNIKKVFILSVITSAAGFIIAVLPQIYINYNLFDKISFLPTMNLGDAQISWGIRNLKYATNLSGIGSPEILYLNPFFHEGDVTQISWYFTHPLNGFKTIFLHIFGALDFDYLFPYIYELYPKYQILLFAFSQIILFWGAYGYFKSVSLLRKKGDVNSKVFFSLLVIVVPVVIIGWTGVIGLSAPENRFALPVVTLLLPFVFFAIYSSWRKKKAIISFLLYLIAAYMLSYFITMQKVIS